MSHVPTIATKSCSTCNKHVPQTYQGQHLPPVVNTTSMLVVICSSQTGPAVVGFPSQPQLRDQDKDAHIGTASRAGGRGRKLWRLCSPRKSTPTHTFHVLLRLFLQCLGPTGHRAKRHEATYWTLEIKKQALTMHIYSVLPHPESPRARFFPGALPSHVSTPSSIRQETIDLRLGRRHHE